MRRTSEIEERIREIGKSTKLCTADACMRCDLGLLVSGHSRILSGIQPAAQTVLGVYLKRTCSRVTSASSAFLNDYALYKSTQSLTL